MQVTASPEDKNNLMNNTNSRRLTPNDYANAGILKLYDRSAKEREAHDKLMEKYRLYLMKLCAVSDGLTIQECEETE